jgi:hypothetical protein
MNIHPPRRGGGGELKLLHEHMLGSDSSAFSPDIEKLSSGERTITVKNNFRSLLGVFLAIDGSDESSIYD